MWTDVVSVSVSDACNLICLRHLIKSRTVTDVVSAGGDVVVALVDRAFSMLATRVKVLQSAVEMVCWWWG